MTNWQSKIVQGYSLARSGVYFLESLPVLFFNRFAHPTVPPPEPEQVKTLWRHVAALHARDAGNIEQGLYPLNVIEFERPLKHLRSYAEVLTDGLRVAWRMKTNGTKDFAGSAKTESAEAPEYYARNFHFQTDGYFSEDSARRYDHQVEILFNGTAGAMRRLILPPMKKHLPEKARLLEVGCGAGSTTRGVAETFPDAKITALDLSLPYLKVAQDQLRKKPKVDFLQGDATKLDFKDGLFDCVYSVYLLHEMPSAERVKVLSEAWRVLKPGGLLIFADSLQWDDQPDLNWALERFPKVYHEPFYKDYVNGHLEDLIKKVSSAHVESDHALFTKAVWALKK